MERTQHQGRAVERREPIPAAEVVVRPRSPRVSVRVMWSSAHMAPPGGRYTEIVEQAGVDLDSMVDARSYIPSFVCDALVAEAKRVSGDPAIALRYGLGADPGMLGLPEYVASTAPTVRAAIAATALAVPLNHEASHVRLVEHGATALVEHTFTEPVAYTATEWVLAYLVAFGRRYCERGRFLREVHFSVPEHADAALYAEVLGLPVRFNTGHDGVLFDRAGLDRTMRSTMPPVHEQLLVRVRRALVQLAESGSFVARVRASVNTQLNEGCVSMERTACRLHTSVATLRRRLVEEGTSYSEVLDELRAEAAKRYLAKPQLTLSEIAGRLGFSHANGFYKAFKRWSGVSPREYRAALG